MIHEAKPSTEDVVADWDHVGLFLDCKEQYQHEASH